MPKFHVEIEIEMEGEEYGPAVKRLWGLGDDVQITNIKRTEPYHAFYWGGPVKRPKRASK